MYTDPVGFVSQLPGFTEVDILVDPVKLNLLPFQKIECPVGKPFACLRIAEVKNITVRRIVEKSVGMFLKQGGAAFFMVTFRFKPDHGLQAALSGEICDFR